MEMFKKKITEFFAQHKNRVPLLIVFVIGLLLIHQGVNSYKKSIGLGGSLTKVLIAKENVNEGDQLTQQNIEMAEVPSQYLPIGVIRPSDFSKIREYALNRSVSKGEMLLWNSLNVHYNYQSPSAKIETGYRAISIPVDTISSVSGLVQPGDHVDIVTTLEIPGESKLSTLTLLQNVSVLSVGDSITNEKTKTSYGSVTLMVLPTEVNLLTHSAKYGNLSLSLRNPTDLKTDPELSIISDQEIVQSAFRNHLQTVRDLAAQTIKAN